MNEKGTTCGKQRRLMLKPLTNAKTQETALETVFRNCLYKHVSACYSPPRFSQDLPLNHSERRDETAIPFHLPRWGR